LNLPVPAYSLKVGSGSHGKMTGRILEKVEHALEIENPECLVVFGDTNTTLAGALAAAKMDIPIVHIESGLRSYRRSMPEEINRKVTDHISQILLCPSEQAVDNLKKEGIRSSDRIESGIAVNYSMARQSKSPIVLNVGDIMIDALQNVNVDDIVFPILDRFEVEGFILATLHRAESTDDRNTFQHLLQSIATLGKEIDVLFPMHPRTKNKMNQLGLQNIFCNTKVHCLPPLSYGQFIKAQARAKIVITDSGGVQKESCILNTPCLTLRDETEWVETITSGWNRLLGTNPDNLSREVAQTHKPKNNFSNIYGDGTTSQQIATVLQNYFKA